MAAAVAAPAVVTGAVVFTDISGFTEFTALRGDAEALAMLSAQEAIVSDELPEGSRLVKEIGDGLLLWFPDACAAVETTLRLQDRFERAMEDSDYPFWVRIGIHWGTQTTRNHDIVGHDVNVAARIVNVAAPGEVLLSESTRAAIAGGLPQVIFDEIGPVVMKGIPAPIRLYRASRSFP